MKQHQNFITQDVESRLIKTKIEVQFAHKF